MNEPEPQVIRVAPGQTDVACPCGERFAPDWSNPPFGDDGRIRVPNIVGKPCARCGRPLRFEIAPR